MSQLPGNNPYAQPSQTYQNPNRPPSGAKIMAPGIALIVTGALGTILSIISIVMALSAAPPEIDPDMPEWFNQMQQGQRGPVAAIIQVCFVFLNLLIIFGGICFVWVKGWGAALTSSIAAMVNFGNCCCIIGLPIGIWALVILNQNDVKTAFERNSK